MNNACLLSTMYWAPIQYYAKLISYPKILIEQYETYPKQTYRNRMVIYGANGLQSLQVPVIKGSFKNILLKDVAISYADNWQKNHIKSIESAYRSSPFYEYYIDDVFPIYTKKYKFLLDLNNEILEISKSMLDINLNIEFTSDFDKDSMYIDFRNVMHPKAPKNIEDNDFRAQKYIQGFEQRYGFIKNLSIIDLVFNTGPDAVTIIKESIVSPK